MSEEEAKLTPSSENHKLELQLSLKPLLLKEIWEVTKIGLLKDKLGNKDKDSTKVSQLFTKLKLEPELLSQQELSLPTELLKVQTEEDFSIKSKTHRTFPNSLNPELFTPKEPLQVLTET